MALWFVGVLFFLIACSRVSSFLSGLIDGRSVFQAINDSFLRPLPAGILIVAVVAVALLFVVIQVATFGAAIWRLFVLSMVMLPLLFLVLAYFNFLGWADQRGALFFDFEYNLLLVLFLMASVLIGVGVLFGLVAVRFMGLEASFSTRVLSSSFLYANAGMLVLAFQLMINMLCKE